MHLKDEIAFEKKAEQFFRSHREVPKGRNFLAWVLRFQNNIGYKSKFDDTFHAAPGSKARLDSEFCPKCGKRKVWCECSDM